MLPMFVSNLPTSRGRSLSALMYSVVTRWLGIVCIFCCIGCFRSAPFLPDLSLVQRETAAGVLFSIDDQDASSHDQQLPEKTAPARERKSAPEARNSTTDGTEEHRLTSNLLNDIFKISKQRDVRETRLRLLFRGMTTGRLELPVQTEAGVYIFRFVFVPSGKFMMGRSERDARNANIQSSSMHHSWSLPEHSVRVDEGYFLGLSEVSHEAWSLYLADSRIASTLAESGQTTPDHDRPAGQSLDDARKPVVNITWFEAIDFCVWLSAKTGLQIRLPSETEFEWAARGPGSFVYSTGDGRPPRPDRLESLRPGGSDPEDVSWCGASDLMGNAREWCIDPWSDDLYLRRTEFLKQQGRSTFFYRPSHVVLDKSDQRRVIRGGDSINDPDSNQQAATRRSKLPETREPTLGFRLMISIDPESTFNPEQPAQTKD